MKKGILNFYSYDKSGNMIHADAGYDDGAFIEYNMTYYANGSMHRSNHEVSPYNDA